MSFRYLLILILFLCQQKVSAQLNNDRCVWVKHFDLPIKLDSLSVVPGTISLSEQTQVKESQNGTFIFKKTDSDSIQVCFKVFPIDFNRTYFNRDLTVYDSNAYFKDPEPVAGFFNKEELFATDGLYKSGSLSRGISFGNNQNVFVNAALNLNIEGQLTEDLQIRAAITDQNVPYQPEGNTQQLQDFDNVYIQIYNDNFSLTGGDVVFKNRPSNFLRYYKNVQGGTASLKYKIGQTQANTEVGFSAAKGKFASVQIPPIEGLSGPYRIPGPNAERFLLILANSERVFLDGNMLKRGFDNDYVIDYNSGELTFTSNVLITEFSRIRVDYEFSDQNYSRAISFGSHEQGIGNFKLMVNAYSEKDNPNRPLLFDLTDNDKQFLSTIGDSLQLATVATIDSVAFSQELILYRRVDYLNPSGEIQHYYQYSNNPDSAFYRVNFSDVGQGNGDYILLQTTANGRVYEFQAPINGVKQGRFSPVALLPTPSKKQMVTVQTSYKVNEFESVFAELAISERDDNLYSTIDNDDNAGMAVKSGIISSGRSIGLLPGFKLESAVDFEVDDKNFNAIDRFRYIEFDRDWNYNPNEDTRRFRDVIVNSEIGAIKDNDNHFKYGITYRDRGTQVQGYQHRARADFELGKFQWRSSLFKMTNSQANQLADWLRYFVDISHKGNWFVPGYRYNVDQNQIRRVANDSITSSAMYFNEHQLYIRNNAESKTTFDLSQTFREDKRPDLGEINDYSRSNTSRFLLQKSLENHQLTTVFNFRQQEYTATNEIEETVSGRLDWSANLFDNHLRSELTYSIANSQELRREFVYIPVPAGEGTHAWRDLNGDGIQDLTEFFEAINADERNYAKIFVPTNDFVSAFQNLFIYRINIDAPRVWREAGGIKRLLSRFSSNTSWSADNKITNSNIESRLLTFIKPIDDEDRLSERTALRSTLFFNRANPTYGLEFTYVDNLQKQLLVNGFDSRANKEYSSNIRINLAQQYSINIFTKKGDKNVASDFLMDRNYDISLYQVSPQISWQPSNQVRFTLQYRLTNKQNTSALENAESAVLDEWVGEVRLNKAIQSNFSAQLRWVNIDFIGDENTPIGYDMLEALRPGRNVTWVINWQQKITKGLQLNLSYNGRKSEQNDPVHVGRVQVSALF